MKIGDTVKKKSNKPFQNGDKIGVISGFSRMEIPLANKQIGTKIVNAVFIKGCSGKVRKSILEEI